MPSRVCIVGSLNIDLVVNVDRLPAPGETVLGGRFSVHDGGKGANQAVAAARAGASVAMIGAVGADAHGERAIAALAAEGIDVTRVRTVDHEPTGVALVAVGPRGENQIVVAPGANGAFELDDADRQTIGGADVVVTNHEVPQRVVLDVLRAAHAAGVTTILNPAPARALASEVLSLGPVLTPNEHELVVAIGNEITGSALDELAARHQGPIVVTQGPAGAILAHRERRERFPGFAAPTVVDTTGAGDAFNGVLAAWLADGASLDEAVNAANAAGALAVSAAGARGGLPVRTAIEALMDAG
jgi:ribokinase